MKRLTEYQAIIVDLDGTLYYQKPVRLAMLKEMLLRFWRLPEFLIVWKYRKLYEQGLGERDRLTRLPANAPQVIREWMIERPLKYVYKYRDAALIDLLKRAEASGCRVIVYSDYPVAEKLEALQFEPFKAFTANDSGCLKPEASGLEKILLSLGVLPEKCLVVGDRQEKDGILAERLGAACIILPEEDRTRIYSAIEAYGEIIP